MCLKHRVAKIPALVVLAITILSPRSGSAQPADEKSYPRVLVIFDFAKATSDSGTGLLKTYAIKIDPASRADRAIVAQLDEGVRSEGDRLAARDAIRKHGATSAFRTFASKGDKIFVYVFHYADEAAVTFKETARERRIDQDLASLVTVVATITPRVFTTDGVKLFRADDIQLAESQAFLSIAASPKAKATSRPTPPAHAAPQCASTPASTQVIVCLVMPSGGNASAPTTGSSTGNAQEAEPKAPATNTVTLTTGPGEHLFLSANAGAANVLQSQYDAKSKSLVPTTPKSFFIGANFSLSDLSTKPRHYLQGLWHDFYIGGLIQADTRPFDQVALVGGWRENFIPKIRDFISFDVVSPYAGVVWAKSDTLLNGERRRRYLKPVLIWGASLNLSKASDWLAPKKADAAKTNAPADPTK